MNEPCRFAFCVCVRYNTESVVVAGVSGAGNASTPRHESYVALC